MNLVFERAFGVEQEVEELVRVLGWDYIIPGQVRCVYSCHSSSRAIARIWSTPRIFSFAFGTNPLYVIELIKRKYDSLSFDDKKKVLIHELMHIPKTFSGALKPHVNMKKHLCKTVDNEYSRYLSLKNNV